MFNLVLLPVWECVNNTSAVKGYSQALNVDLVGKIVSQQDIDLLVLLIDVGHNRYFKTVPESKVHALGCDGMIDYRLDAVIEECLTLIGCLRLKQHLILYVNRHDFNELSVQQVCDHFRPTDKRYVGKNLYSYGATDYFYQLNLPRVFSRVCKKVSEQMSARLKSEAMVTLYASYLCLNTETQQLFVKQISHLLLTLKYTLNDSSAPAADTITVISDIDNTLYDHIRSKVAGVTLLNEALIQFLLLLTHSRARSSIIFYPLTSRYSPKLTRILSRERRDIQVFDENRVTGTGTMANLMDLLRSRMAAVNNFHVACAQPNDERHFTRTPQWQTGRSVNGGRRTTFVPKLWVLMRRIEQGGEIAKNIYFIDDDPNELQPWRANQLLDCCDPVVVKDIVRRDNLFSNSDFEFFRSHRYLKSSASALGTSRQSAGLIESKEKTTIHTVRLRFCEAFKQALTHALSISGVLLYVLQSHVVQRLENAPQLADSVGLVDSSLLMGVVQLQDTTAPQSQIEGHTCFSSCQVM